MRIAIATAGSRGDLQPYVALGRGLARAGHDVVLASHGPYEAFVRAHGLDFRPLAGDPHAMLHSERGLAWLDANDPLSFLVNFSRFFDDMVEPIVTTAFAALEGAEAVIYGPLCMFCADWAEARGIPAVMAGPVPLSPTSDFPLVIMPPAWGLNGVVNYASHQLFLTISSLGLKPIVDRRRRQLGLPPLPFGPLAPDRQGQLRAFYGFSPHVIPRPLDWGPHLEVTGYWFLEPPDGWTPAADLEAFLAAGAPPVYVGFGSMAHRDPGGVARAVFAALERVGRRGVVLKGWGGLGAGEVPAHVHMVEDVPHHWLFPRMAAVVHHGGAGTTAAALRAGVPAVAIPYFADQPFWAARIHQLGVAPPPLPRAALDEDRLAKALAEVLAEGPMRERAALLGDRLRREDGVGNAVAAFERMLAGT